MKVLVATDAHIYKTPDGKHWTPAIYGYSFWKRFLNVFDEVRIVARTKNVDSLDGEYLEVDGQGVEIFSVPFYQGPRELIKVYFKIKKKLKGIEKGCDVALLRMPSQISNMVYHVVKGKLPIGGEIVYDPYDDLYNTNNPFYIRLIDMVISFQLNNFCKEANGVSYVTKKTIQKHYPSRARIQGSSKKYFETYYSTITLDEEAFCQPKCFIKKDKIKISISDVSMNSDRKGEAILLKAVSRVRKLGYDVDVVIIGDGTKKNEFEKLAKELGILDYVTFTGRLSTPNLVRKILKESDMYVAPTQAEGLPRGILEAMAIGLPVLSTPVGGIPEILEPKYLFDPLDIDTLVNKICYLFDNQKEMYDMSVKNYNEASKYKNSILQQRRDEFYRKLVEITKEE